MIGGCKNSNGQEPKITEKSSCPENCSIEYKDSTAEDVEQNMVADSSKENVVVYLEAYLDGNVKGYAGDKLLFDEKVETEESLGTTGKYFTYNYSEDSTLPKLKVELSNECIEFDINKKYKLIYVSYYQGKWNIIYSNVYPTYE
jgi:hypothetical protein